MPFDKALGNAVFSEEFEECTVSFDISRKPLLEMAMLKGNSISMDETSIPCIFISMWDDGAEISSNAKINSITRSVYDIETAGLPEGVLNNLDICTGEYVELSGKRFPLGEMRQDGSYSFAESLEKGSVQNKSLYNLLKDISKESRKTQHKDVKQVYHERF